MFSYLQFLVKSTNQHGVHSPFVYNYITKGLYNAKKNLQVSNKTNQWLLHSIQYFQPNAVYISDNALLDGIKDVSVETTVALSNADLILDHYTLENHARIVQTINSMNNSQLLLIASYKKYPKSFFNELRKNPEITLVVDFYYGCLISKRTEQPKQNFFIRY
ncbi:hypothetical protein SAMN05421741_12123 [Paenimyroides ummariense]|uniref:Uncharacterized protein n=1 Tax=Paenimyroides ummariense TaxID=913024 RepID=A0A1I5EKX5_9FLAO|nr:hypothetical protein [Paenimyroides ummariense]SFO12157.1 hypothetical protein SAMN05421741_12123 [Paenimyroides ummariense]